MCNIVYLSYINFFSFENCIWLESSYSRVDIFENDFRVKILFAADLEQIGCEFWNFDKPFL